MGFRQVEQFFDAGAEADAEQLTAPEGDQRVRQLVATAVGIGPRVHEAEHPVAAVGRNDDHDREGDEQADDEHGEQARLEAAQEEDAHGDGDDHHEGAEVRLLEQQAADHRHGPEHGQEGLLQVMHDIDLAHRVVGRVEHGEQLHQFGRLQVGKAERYPAAGTIDVAADAGNEDQRQQHDAGHEQVRRVALPELERHLEGDGSGDQADAQENTLADQVVGRLMTGRTAALGNGDGGRVNEDQAGEQQDQHAPQQGVVDFRHLATGSVEGADHHGCNPCTASMKAWARWA